MRIGIDLMGSDTAPLQMFEAVLQAKQQLDSSTVFIVIATHRVISDLKQQHPNNERIEFHAVSDAIAMADEPLTAVFHKKGSSLVVGVRLLKKHYLDAFVSAGNTGALIASASLQIPHLPGIKRPVLLAEIPSINGPVAVLDIGGTVSCKAQNLVQYAYLGAAYQKARRQMIPKIGLLNIGVEPKKGTSAIREAYQILQSHSPNSEMQFIGNIEGRDVFQGVVDVVVTDGFTGNVFLKTSEGVANFIFDYIQKSLKTDSEMRKTLEGLQRNLNYAEYPGAFICGIEGLIIKCHGNSTVKGILNGIKGAHCLYQQQMIPKLKSHLSK